MRILRNNVYPCINLLATDSRPLCLSFHRSILTSERPSASVVDPAVGAPLIS